MKRPNIVVCLCDQMRAFEVGCYGHPVVQTPAIDALAEDGVRFEVAVSNNPVCTPGRSCLISGQYSRTCTGRIANETDEAAGYSRPRFPSRVLPEVLRDNGYRTALIGKWHIGSHPGLMGFDEYIYPKFHHLNKHQMYFDRDHRGSDVPGYAEDFNQRKMGEFLDTSKGSDQPFFAFYNIATPHMPFFDVPPEYQEMYGADVGRACVPAQGWHETAGRFYDQGPVRPLLRDGFVCRPPCRPADAAASGCGPGGEHDRGFHVRPLKG